MRKEAVMGEGGGRGEEGEEEEGSRLCLLDWRVQEVNYDAPRYKV